VAVLRAGPTEDFPVPWHEQLASRAGERERRARAKADVPEELRPRDGAIARPKAVAMVIGIESYSKDLPEASGAEHDAELFAELAHRTLGLKRSRIRLLVGSDATKSSIDAELDEWLAKNADPAGEAFFFFAGHGAPDPESGESYLVPWDADPKYVRTQGIAVSELVGKLAGSNAQHTYAFLDACFSGSGGRSVLAKGTRPLVRVRDLQAPSGGLSLLTAAAADEVTGAAPSGNGLFSYHLLAGLNGRADADRDGAITLAELVEYTQANVTEQAAEANRDQSPQAPGLTEEAAKAVLTRLPPRRE